MSFFYFLFARTGTLRVFFVFDNVLFRKQFSEQGYLRKKTLYIATTYDRDSERSAGRLGGFVLSRRFAASRPLPGVRWGDRNERRRLSRRSRFRSEH
jgi:hypothetical protein